MKETEREGSGAYIAVKRKERKAVAKGVKQKHREREKKGKLIYR